MTFNRLSHNFLAVKYNTVTATSTVLHTQKRFCRLQRSAKQAKTVCKQKYKGPFFVRKTSEN